MSLKGNRVYSEKWVDVERAMQSPGGQRLMERISSLESGDSSEPIWSSVAVYREQIPAPEELKKQGADWVVKIHSIDHDAILLDEPPAAGPEKGVGLMVNADQAISLQPNSGALIGESYREREQRLDRAAKAKFAPGENEYAWVADFTDSQAVIVRNGGGAEVFGYKSDGGVITFDDTGTAVARQESWVAIVANKFKSLFTPQEQPATNHKTEGDMPLTKEELEQLGSMVSEAVATNTEKAIKPLAEKVDALQANQQQLAETLTANSRAEEKAKREAVAKVHGEIVANALSGEALDAMFKTIGESAPLGTNSAQQQKETGAPAASEYFK
ncbi:gp7 [Salmonella enterica subsp. enterica serovar Rissen]|nr:gp7 [Salmonella enterica subsp. enterica serovar Rissen]